MKKDKVPLEILRYADEDACERLRQAADENPLRQLQRLIEAQRPQTSRDALLENWLTKPSTQQTQKSIKLHYACCKSLVSGVSSLLTKHQVDNPLHVAFVKGENSLFLLEAADSWAVDSWDYLRRDSMALSFDGKIQEWRTAFPKGTRAVKRSEYTFKVSETKSPHSPNPEVDAVQPRLVEISQPPSPETMRAVSVAESTFEAFSLLVPKRIRDEELGDAAEAIYRLVQLDRPAWQIYVKIASTSFWILVNALREMTSAGLGKLRSK